MNNETPTDFQVLHEFIKKARINLDQNVWEFLIGGSETETAVKRNRLALDSLAFRPRVLVDVSAIDCSWGFLGKRIRLPVAFAPVGSLQTFEAGGGATVAAAAGRFGVPIFVSSRTQPSLEAIARAGDGPKVFQLYVRGDDDKSIDEVTPRAIDAGYDAFCFTVDTPVHSRRERDIAKRFRMQMVTGPNQRYQAALTWGHIERFKARYNLPLILKGIATTEDAERAVGLGVDVIYVSNHGGRQLDYSRGSADVLPEIVAAVAGRAKVYVDGGFSRGTDIIKGIALGADLVVVGRLYCYALAAAGEAGLVRMLEILQAEVHQSLGLLGVTSFGQLNRGHVQPAPPVVLPHVHSAFPLLNFDSPY
jgi:isopentenyl diphosphate isomerase/L-lactate dehydrogenase-like FMN-dependent dehydrogenase